MSVGAILIVFLVGYSAAWDPGCDFTKNVQSGEIYYIYNKEYPFNYKPGSQCRWRVTCPLGYNCKVDCNVLNITETPSCSVDRLLISRTGNPQPSSSEYYCGRDSVSAVSVGRTITVVLNSSIDSMGGNFLCELVAQLDTSVSKSPCTCGYSKTDHIGGGKETTPGQFPMMAGIVYVEESAIKCGAVIISKYYVLTAAHCVKGKSLNQIGVFVGENHTSSGNDSFATQLFKVQWYKVHPQFNTVTYEYDIAAVKIVGEIVFSPTVGPVCLPFKFANDDFNGAIVTVLGWGTQKTTGDRETSEVLRKVDMSVVSHVTCHHYNSAVTPRQVCTYASGNDTCLEESGGPVLHKDTYSGLLYLVGIVSYGKSCTWTMPGVNTRITALLDWIVITAPDNYCVK